MDEDQMDRWMRAMAHIAETQEKQVVVLTRIADSLEAGLLWKYGPPPRKKIELVKDDEP